VDAPSPPPLASYDWQFHRRCQELIARPCEPEVLRRLVDRLQQLRGCYALAAVGTLLADAYSRLGDAAAAEQVLQQDVDAGIADQWTHYWLAHHQAIRGDFEQAALHIRRSHGMRGWPQSEAHGYVFSHDHFSGFIGEWQGWFQTWIRQSPLEVVLVGAGQGGTALWLLDHVIAARGGSLLCLDSWTGSSGHPLLDQQLAAAGHTVEQLFDANISRSGHAQQPGRVRKLAGEVLEHLAGLPLASADLVWIDAAADAAEQIQRQVLAHRLLRPGGFLVMDGYRPRQPLPARDPAQAVDFFRNGFRNHYRLLARGQQQLLQRRSLASQALPERLLLLLGMHRSGTSALAGLLQSQGFQAPLDVPSADVNNPSGYWEPQRIVACHTALMEQLRTSWDDPLLVEDAFAGDRLPPALEKLEQALAQAFPPAGLAPGAVALVKDPRQCRLQPLWNALLDAHQIEAAAVLIVREPLAVVRSLQRRDQLPVNRALLLWLQYTLEAERHTRQLPRLLLSYRQLLADPDALLGRCRQFWPEQRWSVEGSYRIDPSLNHGQERDAQLEAQAEPALLELANTVYGLMVAPVPDLEQLEQAHGQMRQRLRLVEEQLGRNVTLQLFWQLAGQPEFSEPQSTRLSLAIGRGQAQARLPLPPLAAGATVVALRLDPAEQPGLVNLEQLSLLDQAGERLWQWQAAEEQALPLQPATPATRLVERSIVGLDHDPSVVLQIPEAALAGLGPGGTLLVVAQWEPLSAELGAMLKAIS
jgi:hypothetical protein